MQETWKLNYQRLKYNALSEVQQALIEAAKAAAQRAYAPYSNFWVGAALRLQNGEILTGNNQENAAYPSGTCAERTLLFYTKAQFPSATIEEMAIIAHPAGDFLQQAVSPCGSCRQVMAEAEQRQDTPVSLILPAQEEDTFLVLDSFQSLLPFSFGADALGL